MTRVLHTAGLSNIESIMGWGGGGGGGGVGRAVIWAAFVIFFPFILLPVGRVLDSVHKLRYQRWQKCVYVLKGRFHGSAHVQTMTQAKSLLLFTDQSDVI